MMLGGTYLLREAQARADREKAIIGVMGLFPGYYDYKSHPTFEQFVSFVYDAEAAGYSLKDLYSIFASGKIPPDLDQLIRQHAEHWRPSGEIVESELEIKRIEGS